jgi:hypothetical protein
MSLAHLFQPPKPIAISGPTVVHAMGDEPEGAWNNLMRLETVAKARAARSLAHLSPEERKQRRREVLRQAKARYLDKQKGAA